MSESLPPDPGQPGPLTHQALQLRNSLRCAAHPVENTLRYFRALLGDPGEACDRGLDFQSAESLHRAGAQGLPLPEIPQLPHSVVQLSRLRASDLAGEKHLRLWAEKHDATLAEAAFDIHWQAQGRLGGAEHHVHHDEATGRWFKRLYQCVNGCTLGDYFDRMRLHAVLFPETAYRLEGFVINPKSKALAPVVSQPHVEVALDQPLVTPEEVAALMDTMGFAYVRLSHNGVVDDGYHAYYHAATGVLVHDLHDENVVRMARTHELAVIDPDISLARRGTWTAQNSPRSASPFQPTIHSLRLRRKRGQLKNRTQKIIGRQTPCPTSGLNHCKSTWWAHWDSNPEPRDYESPALTVEL